MPNLRNRIRKRRLSDSLALDRKLELHAEPTTFDFRGVRMIILLYEETHSIDVEREDTGV